ncbi:MAG: thioredoxin-like domain-containing protein [Bacteroidia bacterium]|nr:thioredoxin-like domain-containing protein [Bacteroidia bacterium]
MRRAPEFPPNLQWLNVSRPLRLHEDLRGRFVLLDFWTYCCINCMHVLPELKRIEKEFPQLTVIGVHSAKFDNEQDVENIRAAILRYDIEHPVLVDVGYRVWQAYGVHAWPTFVLISPRGDVLWQSAGEGIYERLVPLLPNWIKSYEKALSPSQLPLRLEKHSRAKGLLAFPGKLALAKRPSKREPILYLSDSNHNRIIGISLFGEVQEVIGSGSEGLKDGSYEEAEFFRPQGLSYDAQTDALYVADTENHAIRKIDLQTRRVQTIAGRGQQARRLLREGHGPHIPLNSPWDVAVRGETLYIAMAGCHQIWTLNLKTLHSQIYAGSGYENIIDGPRFAAALAQPSGLALAHDGNLYFADSETSSIRYIEGDQVKTLVGKGLFEFGMKDGEKQEALLQHPIGLCYHEGNLYIADTYNHAIRRLNLQTGQLETIAGTGKRGYKDGPAHQAEFNEPNDILYAEGYFYITDTNNHLLRRYDPKRDVVETMELYPLDRLAWFPKRQQAIFPEAIPLPPQAIPKGKSWTLHLNLPLDYKLTEAAPHTLRIHTDSFGIKDTLPTLSGPSKATLTLYLCEKDHERALCFPVTYILPLIPDENTGAEVHVTLPEIQRMHR